MRLMARLAALVGTALCVAGLSVPAGAGQSDSSRVTLKVASGPPVHGRVISRNPACISNRKVVLIETEPERAPIDYADNRTNGRGKWIFSSQLQGATVVQAKVGESKSSGVTCRPALSPAKGL